MWFCAFWTSGKVQPKRGLKLSPGGAVSSVTWVEEHSKPFWVFLLSYVFSLAFICNDGDILLSIADTSALFLSPLRTHMENRVPFTGTLQRLQLTVYIRSYTDVACGPCITSYQLLNFPLADCLLHWTVSMAGCLLLVQSTWWPYVCWVVAIWLALLMKCEQKWNLWYFWAEPACGFAHSLFLASAIVEACLERKPVSVGPGRTPCGMKPCAHLHWTCNIHEVNLLL